MSRTRIEPANVTHDIILTGPDLEYCKYMLMDVAHRIILTGPDLEYCKYMLMETNGYH